MSLYGLGRFPKDPRGCDMRRIARALWLSLFLAAPAAAPADDRIKLIDPDGDAGTSAAVVVGRAALAHTAQLLPLDQRGELVGRGDAARQAEAVLDNLAEALSGAKTGLDRVVKVNVYVAGAGVVNPVRAAFARRFGGAGPAASFVVSKLPHRDALVAMDAVAVSGTEVGQVRRLRRDRLPGAEGGSHVAVLPAGGAVYVSGQAEKGDLAEATRKTLESLRATLKHLALTDADVVQLKAFLRPMSDVAVVEKEMAGFFGEHRVPPLVFVEWSSSLPVEIELVAASKEDRGRPALEFLTPPGMQASPLYSRVARVNHGKTIYVSGLYGTKDGKADEQIEEIFGTLGKVVEKAGGDFRHLAKATYYVADDETSRKLNELRPKYYDPKRPPAASKAMVAGVGREKKSVTLDLIAVPAK